MDEQGIFQEKKNYFPLVFSEPLKIYFEMKYIVFFNVIVK